MGEYVHVSKYYCKTHEVMAAWRGAVGRGIRATLQHSSRIPNCSPTSNPTPSRCRSLAQPWSHAFLDGFSESVAYSTLDVGDPRQRSVTRRSSPRGWGFVPYLSACRSFGESEISRRRGHRRSGLARPPHACKVPFLQCCFAGGVCRDDLQAVMNIAPYASSNMPCPMERSTRTGAASVDLNTKFCGQPAES